MKKELPFDSDFIFAHVLKKGKVRPDFSQNANFFIKALQAEIQFQKVFLSEKRESDRIYKIFISNALQHNNLRGSRVNFRIRQAQNYKQVYVNIKTSNVEGLQKVQINATFVSFVFKYYQGKNLEKLKELFEEYKFNRNKLVLNNSPMILRTASRSKKYMPKSIVAEVGAAAFLASVESVDKYCPKFKNGIPVYSENLLSCMNSRIKAALGLMMSSRNVHLGFRGRKYLFKIPRLLKEGLTEEEICVLLKTTPDEIKSLASATDFEYIENDFKNETASGDSPEEIVVKNEQLDKLRSVIDSFDLIEKKILVLKGLASIDVLD